MNQSFGLHIRRRFLDPFTLTLLLVLPFFWTACEGTSRDHTMEANACSVNADCADSPEAERVRYLRCLGIETICQGGQCLGRCKPQCQAVVADVNPCPDGAFCGAGPGTGLCSLSPIACTSVASCPIYRPSDAPASFAWTCTDGFCVAPGVSYATR